VVITGTKERKEERREKREERRKRKKKKKKEEERRKKKRKKENLTCWKGGPLVRHQVCALWKGERKDGLRQK